MLGDCQTCFKIDHTHDGVDVNELDMVSLDHFSTILPLMVFYLCPFGQQFYIKVDGEFCLLSHNRGLDHVGKLKFSDMLV